jgi:hypothetical protein
MMHSYSLIQRLPWLNGGAPQHSREAATACIAAILDEIEREKRQPDAWEAQDLICAIWFIGMRLYPTAIAYARRALMPPDERLELYPIVMPDNITIEMLRNSLFNGGSDEVAPRVSLQKAAVGTK